ncbi:hypothetical protein AJ80_03809 [Polytolypa hystricis UAMH7299]|uniref:Extracellular membrane protein CFEM domain-containing protein n=1 Tax=Polytolypa hystricis (strain UAMH7299) TaxID=1447883 RepID=A0A2B7Y678_POLH7|nr:hypothetical protein AJ80_03809 [Polytolypa hystricis UAMH7299]
MAKILFILTALAATALSQTLVPSEASDNFPACALECQILKDAQTPCVPPAVSDGDQASYTACYCGTEALQPLLSTPYGVCDSVCTTVPELNTVMKWFVTLCGTEPPKENTATTTTAGAPKETKSEGGVQEFQGDDGQMRGDNDDVELDADSDNPPIVKANHEPPPNWIVTHWRWVVMIVVLVVGFTLITLLLVYLKRRHNRKRLLQAGAPAAMAASTAAPSRTSRIFAQKPPPSNLSAAGNDDSENNWGPQQHQAHTRGWDFVDAELPVRPPQPADRDSASSTEPFFRGRKI